MLKYIFMPDYSLHYSRNISRRSKRSNIKAVAVTIMMISTLGYLLIRSQILKKAPENGMINPVIENSPAPSINKHIPTDIQIKENNLTAKLENVTSSMRGSYYIYINDIKNNREYGVNEKTVLSAASVNKIPILAALYHLAGKKEIDLEKVIVPQLSDIQDYGTGIIRYDKAGTSYSLKTLARLMMEKSDNTAAYLLGSPIIGLDRIQKLVESWGLTQTDMTANKTTVKDMSILMVKMYKREITSEALSEEMLGFMDKSDFDDRLPLGLPEGTVIFHKTGNDVGNVHDVGIVDLKDRPYYIGIFTSDISDEEEAKKNIAMLSSLVYDFFK